MCKTILLAAILLIPTLIGCQAINANNETRDTVNVETLYSSLSCGGSSHQEPSPSWLESQEQLNLTWENLQSNLLGGKRPVAPQVDFATHNVLLIRMGMQKSGGYRLELTKKTAIIEDHTAIIHINWIEPDEGAFVTQVITSPCLLLKLERGNYRTIHVKDQFGKLRTSVVKSN